MMCRSWTGFCSVHWSTLLWAPVAVHLFTVSTMEPLSTVSSARSVEMSARDRCVQTQTHDITEHDAIKCILNAKRTIINEPNLFVFFRRTSWTWQCVFVVCLVWKTLCGTCLWQKSCLRAITYTAVHSVTDWSLLPRSVPIFRQRKYSSEEYNAVNICTFLPCSTLQWFLPLYLH